MRKLLIAAVLISTTVSFTSCSKDYDCRCVNQNGVTVSNTTVNATSETEAQEKCDDVCN